MKKIISLVCSLCILFVASISGIASGFGGSVPWWGLSQWKVTLNANIEDIIGGKQITMDYDVELISDGQSSDFFGVIGGETYIKYTLDGSDPLENGEYYYKNNGSAYTISLDNISLTEVGEYDFRAVVSVPNQGTDEYKEIITIEQLDEPEFRYEQAGKRKKVEIIAADEADIYYKIENQGWDLYDDSFYIAESVNISAYAVQGGFVTSDTVNEYVEVTASELTEDDQFDDEEVPNDDSEYEDDEENYDDEEDYNLDSEEEFDEDEESISSKIIFDSSNWAMDELNDAYENNLIPEKMLYDDMALPIWRDEFAAIAVKLYEHLSGEEAPRADAGDTPFEDLGISEYSDYIASAYKLGLVYGITEYKYGSHDSITREQLATMLARVIKKISFEDWSIDDEYYYRGENYFLSKYRDPSYYDFLFADNADISGYAVDSVYFMAENNVVYGIDESHFAPQSNATVEQAILIALRCMNEYPDMDLDLFVSSYSNY